MFEHYQRVYMMSVQEKWKEENFLPWIARRLALDVSDVSLQMRVPNVEFTEEVIDHLAWDQCSIDPGKLPSDRLPTLEEIRSIFSYRNGGD